MGKARAIATYLTYRGLGTAMGRMPEPMAHTIATAVARAMSFRQGPGTPSAMNVRHMRRVLASECAEGVEPDPALVRRMSRRTYIEYAHYWADGARLPFVSPEGVRGQFWMYGEENLRAATSAGNGVVVALPHVGSWEWGAAWLALEGMPMTAVVERLQPEQLFEWFLAQRAAMGLTGIPLGEGAGPATIQAIKSGQIVGLVSDRDLSGTGVEVTFFGERTRLPGGAATMALRTGAALLPAAVYMGPGNWHTGVVAPPLDTTRQGTMREDVTRLTQELATIFEGYIRRAPEQWHLYQPNWPSDRVVGGSVAGEFGSP